MRTDATCGPGLEAADDFRITILYDTLENGLSAMRTCHRIIAEFGADFLFHIALCDFRSLESRTSGTGSIQAAFSSSLVLISANPPLPECVREWLDEWAINAQDRPLAIALMTREPLLGNSTAQRIEQFCATHGVDLITPPGLRTHAMTSVRSRAARGGNGGAPA